MVILVASLKSGHFTFFSNEEPDMKSIKQLAIYKAFKYDTKIRKYFIGIYLVSKMVGNKLSNLPQI